MPKIRFNCPSCGQGLSVARRHGGQKGRCPRCGKSLTVPPASDRAGFEARKDRTAPARPSTAAGFFKDRVLKNRYQVTSLLAAGDTGTTFSGMDGNTGRPVVIKVIQFTKIPDVRTLHLFKKGIGVLKHLDHPLIPDHVDSFSVKTGTEEFHVLVREHVKGDSLSGLITKGRRFSIDQVYRILKSLLEILSYIHNLQPPFIHRDITPKNIIIDENGKAHLVDFGAVGGIVTDSLRADDVYVGTMGYMGPEQICGRAVPASDLYAAGVCIIYLLSGTDPLEMNLENGKLDFRRHCNAPAPFLDLLDEMVAADLEKRIKTARHALKKLGKITGYADADTGVLEKAEPQLTARVFFTRLFSAKTPKEIFRIFTREMPMEVRLGLFALVFILILSEAVSLFNRPAAPTRAISGHTIEKKAVQDRVDQVLLEKQIQKQKAQQERINGLKKFSPGARLEKEPNDELSRAMDISMGSVAGITDPAGGRDWFRFNVPNGFILTVLLENAKASDAVLYRDLYDPKQTRMFSSASAAPGQKAETTLMMNKSSGGFYYAAVKGEKENLFYRLTLSARPQNDGGVRSDAGDDLAAAVSVDPGTPVKGKLGGLDKEDWYQLYAPGAAVFSLRFSAGPEAKSRISLKLLDRHNNRIWQDLNVNPLNVKTVQIPFGKSGDTELYLKVGYSHLEIATYEFTYSNRGQDDGHTRTDAGGKRSRALALTAGYGVSGVLGGLDLEDWYVFTPQKGQSLEFTTAETGDFRLAVAVFDPDGNRLFSASRIGPMKKKTYVFRRIRRSDGAAPVQYSLRVACAERHKKTCAFEVMPYRIKIKNPD